jgi:hypothetical protein
MIRGERNETERMFEEAKQMTIEKNNEEAIKIYRRLL